MLGGTQFAFQKLAQRVPLDFMFWNHLARVGMDKLEIQSNIRRLYTLESELYYPLIYWQKNWKIALMNLTSMAEKCMNVFLKNIPHPRGNSLLHQVHKIEPAESYLQDIWNTPFHNVADNTFIRFTSAFKFLKNLANLSTQAWGLSEICLFEYQQENWRSLFTQKAKFVDFLPNLLHFFFCYIAYFYLFILKKFEFVNLGKLK